MCFVLDEGVDAVFSGESFNEIAFVLPRPPHDVIGDAGIERTVPAACQHVNEIEMLAHARSSQLSSPASRA